ncbi:hypothetical protein ACLOJK_030202 [Asimina triloba]
MPIKRFPFSISTFRPSSRSRDQETLQQHLPVAVSVFIAVSVLVAVSSYISVLVSSSSISVLVSSSSSVVVSSVLVLPSLFSTLPARLQLFLIDNNITYTHCVVTARVGIAVVDFSYKRMTDGPATHTSGNRQVYTVQPLHAVVSCGKEELRASGCR